MSLSLYKKKRSFQETPEPTGSKKSSSSSKLRFVVQKHDASRLHYDFRLEMEGVLKSWAVPKGPSLNPDEKRLAMMVEDHPYDYRSFEGIIPEGNYGAGAVIVWDEGTYEPMEDVGGSSKENEKHLLKQLQKGDLKIRLYGEKLNGDFALVKMKGRQENAWLLIKKKDNYATDKDITRKSASVKSGKTLEQITKATKSKSSQLSSLTKGGGKEAVKSKAASPKKTTPSSKLTSTVKKKSRRRESKP